MPQGYEATLVFFYLYLMIVHTKIMMFFGTKHAYSFTILDIRQRAECQKLCIDLFFSMESLLVKR